MRAVPVQETIGAGLVPVQDEILAQQAHGLRCLVVQLGHGGDGHPVTPKQLSHRRPSADLHQPPVLFVAQHRFGPQSRFSKMDCLEVSLEITFLPVRGRTQTGDPSYSLSQRLIRQRWKPIQKASYRSREQMSSS